MKQHACCVVCDAWRVSRVSCFVFGLALLCCISSANAQPEKLPALLPPHGELHATFWELHGWQCVAAGIVLLAIVIATIVWLRRPKPAIVEPPAVLARRALEALRGRTEDGALVMNVSRILKGYVLAILNLPPEELTTTEFRRVLQSYSEMDSNLAAATSDFLQRCDEWKFSREHLGEPLRAVESALEFIGRFEAGRNAVKMEVA